MTIHTIIVTGDDEGDHHSDGSEAYLSLPNGSVPEVTAYAGDIWLKNPTIVSFQPEFPQDDKGRYLQVADPIWAVRGLWTALQTLVRIEDIHELIAEKSPQILADINTMLSYTQELAAFDPPIIQEEVG